MTSLLPRMLPRTLVMVTMMMMLMGSSISQWSHWSCVAGTWRRTVAQTGGSCGGQVREHM